MCGMLLSAPTPQLVDLKAFALCIGCGVAGLQAPAATARQSRNRAWLSARAATNLAGAAHRPEVIETGWYPWLAAAN